MIHIGALVTVRHTRMAHVCTIVSAIGNQVSTQLKAGAPIEVYAQTRSIVGSVRHLYSVGSNEQASA